MSSRLTRSLRAVPLPLVLLAALTLAFAHGVGAQNAQNSATNTNTGNTNTGNTNTGNTNTGNTNTGNTNTGNTNTGNTNRGAGNTNAGNTNAGNADAGAGPPSGGTPDASKEPPCARDNRRRPVMESKPGASLNDLQVVSVHRADTNDERERGRAGLYNTICVEVHNLAEWVRADPKKNDPYKFILYIDTYPLPKVTSRPEANGSDYLRFDLERTDDKTTQDNWRSILNRPKLIFPTARRVPITIGYDADPNQRDEVPLSTTVYDFLLVDVNPGWFFLFAAAFLAALVFFIYLARRSDLLRDSGPEPGGVDKHGRPNRRPFSLGRTQMAFWFFIVIACYIFIWMVTSNGNTITNTVLGLIGISAATALGSVFITNSKSGEADEERARLRAERDELTNSINELKDKRKVAADEFKALPTEIAALEALGSRSPAQEQELAARKARLAELTVTDSDPPKLKEPLSATEIADLRVKEDRLYKVKQLLAGASRGFFTDILSDAGGVSFHRFQIVAWTVALGVIFLAQVFNYLMMPEFDATLLALMGISSGTYLGFKLPERQAQTT